MCVCSGAQYSENLRGSSLQKFLEISNLENWIFDNIQCYDIYYEGEF